MRLRASALVMLSDVAVLHDPEIRAIHTVYRIQGGKLMRELLRLPRVTAQPEPESDGAKRVISPSPSGTSAPTPLSVMIDGIVNAAVAVKTTSPDADIVGGYSVGAEVPSGDIHPDAATVTGNSVHAAVPGWMSGAWQLSMR